MSLRHLKKVFDSEDGLPTVIASSEEENILETRPAGQNRSKGKRSNKKAGNKFELLAAMEAGAEADDDNNADDIANEDEERGSDSDGDTSKKTSRKKQRRKKKKQTSSSDNTEQAEMKESNSRSTLSASQTDQKATKTHQDDIPEEFELSNEEREEIARVRKLEELFAIDPKSMNPENELKKMFGSKVIRQEKSTTSGTRFYNTNQHRRNLLSRRGRLVYPKEQRTLNGASGITLELLSTDARTGVKTFKFNHSQAYRDVQRQFLAAVNTLNPDTIVNLMRSHPYHIDAHIQLSDMAKHSEDMQIASELVEDGINYLQNVFDHQFDICSPTCQLPYKYQENRALHILLFKYLVFLGQRGCPRTALQLCKKLLSLDPIYDPLCVTLMVDFYALKSKEFVWLCDLYEMWNTERNLNQLPNWAYSIALAYFMRHNEGETKQQAKSSGSKASTSSGMDLEAKSNELLQYALLMFPSVLLPLLEKCGIQSDSKVINHWYFNSTISKNQTKSLNLLCDLYVWRTHHLWRDASILRWLEFNTQAMISQIEQDKKLTNDFAQKRQRRYAGTPYNILRHVIVTDSKDITIPLPPELSKKPLLSFDPITPHNAVDIYNYQQRDPSRPSAAAATNNGLLSMLFRSLVFDLNAGQGPPVFEGPLILGEPQPRDINGAVPIDGGAGVRENNGGGLPGIHDSVNTLLNAMRDLLHVVAPTEAGGGEQADLDSSDDNSEHE